MLASLSKNSVYRAFVNSLWFTIILGLSLTSFPLLSKLTGAIVAPFSAIPLFFLILIWFVPFLLGKGTFPAEIIPLLYFVLIALVVSGLGFFLQGYYKLNLDFLNQIIRAFFTLVIALSFYLVFSVFPGNEKALKKTLGFIYISAGILILLTLFEFIMIRTYGRPARFPEWLISFRRFLAVQSLNVFSSNRVSGFAYEPSWFAQEFSLIFFPLWLSAVYQRKSIFKFRLWFIQIEDILLVAGLIVFGLGSPRIGLLAFVLSVAYIGYLLFRDLHKKILKWLLNRRKHPFRHQFLMKFLLAFLLISIIVVGTGSLLAGYILSASRWDDRFQTLLDEMMSIASINVFQLSEAEIMAYAKDFVFLERVVYWSAGWKVFNSHPFGVGLGNAGFYLGERFHGAGYDSPEIRDLLYRANYLPNTKNLWTRLLAETGFIGLAVFLIWLYILWRSSALMRKSQSTVLRIMGLAGQLFLLAYLVEGFSMDSFAMPYQWVMAGLISAGGLIARREFQTKDKHEESLSAPA